jgi:hypothetical protein
MLPPPKLSPEIIRHSHLLYHSFEKVTGHILINLPSSADVAEALYTAPFVLLSHGTEPDPIFNYANLTAQRLWELDWEHFTRMPSRLSAEKISQAERHAMLEEARRRGFIGNYQGIRISSTGKRFLIKEAILWNVHDEEGNYRGQAATFHQWEFLSL